MLEQKELKLLRLNVNKTKMVKLCRSYFPLLKNKKFNDFYFFKSGSFFKLECGSYEFYLSVCIGKVRLSERYSDVSFVVELDDLFKFDLVKEIC